MEVLTDHLREVPVPWLFQAWFWTVAAVALVLLSGDYATDWNSGAGKRVNSLDWKMQRQWALSMWCFFCRTPMLSSKICPTYAWLALVALAMWGVASWSWAQVIRNMKLWSWHSVLIKTTDCSERLVEDRHTGLRRAFVVLLRSKKKGSLKYLRIAS